MSLQHTEHTKRNTHLQTIGTNVKSALQSGNKEARKHKLLWVVTVQWDGVSRSGVQGSKIYMLSPEPRDINLFVRVPYREKG